MGLAWCLQSNEEMMCHHLQSKHLGRTYFQQLARVGCQDLSKVSRASLLLNLSPRANSSKPPFPHLVSSVAFRLAFGPTSVLCYRQRGFAIFNFQGQDQWKISHCSMSQKTCVSLGCTSPARGGPRSDCPCVPEACPGSRAINKPCWADAPKPAAMSVPRA